MGATDAHAHAGRWQPYTTYKPSGVAWLGKVPTHWGVKPLVSVARLQRGHDLTTRERLAGDVPVYSSSGLSGYHNEAKAKAPGVVTGRYGTIGKIYYVEQDYWPMNTTLYVSDFKGNYARFIYYLLMILPFDAHSDKSAVPGVDRNDLHVLAVTCPAQTEQVAIAAFLDRETARLDALIAKKQRLIELLQEKRTALISQAVTKGLDPNVAMKDSGIPSIAQVPAHWTVERNKWIFSEVNDRSTTGEEELLTVSHITGVTPRSEKQEVTMFLAESKEGYKRCNPGDLVINTMWAWMGALGITNYEGIVSPSYNVYRLLQKYAPKYLDYLYRTSAYVSEIIRYSQGVWTSRLRLYPDEFFLMSTPTPPLPEQQAIVEYIEQETGRYRKFIARLEESIERLSEYRTALISAAVTGKIDVRPSPLT
jgi:type I restriction enzyme, S subunit